jgi:serine/threonine protein kinase
LLADCRKREEQLANHFVVTLLNSTADALAFLHGHCIVHCDITPGNILMDYDGAFKVANFTLAREMASPSPMTQDMTTLWYRPPELLLGAKCYAGGVDMWSLGCVVDEAASLHPTFPGDSEVDTLFKIFQKLGPPTRQSDLEISSEMGTFFKIFQKLGTPTRQSEPETCDPPRYTEALHSWRRQEKTLPACQEKLDPVRYRWVLKCLTYDPAKRPEAGSDVHLKTIYRI